MNQNIKEVIRSIQNPVSKRGRPKGSKNKPKFQYKTTKEYIFLFPASSGIIPLTLRDAEALVSQIQVMSKFRDL